MPSSTLDITDETLVKMTETIARRASAKFRSLQRLYDQDDLVQECVIAVLLDRGKLTDAYSSPEAWVYAVCRGTLLDLTRKFQAGGSATVELSDRDSASATNFEAVDARIDFRVVGLFDHIQDDDDDTRPPAPASRGRKTRSSRRLYARGFVRLVNGTQLYQARPWHPEVGSINLGCYRNERDAGRAVQAWIDAGSDPCKGLPDGILPKWVKRLGELFYWSCDGRRGRGGDDLHGPYHDPVEAHNDARAAKAIRRPSKQPSLFG